MKIINRIKEIIEPVIQNIGLELFDITFSKESGRWILRVFIDKSEAEIQLSECEKVSNMINQALDKEDFISQRYNLEVSSPGLDRPLKSIDDFIKFNSKLVNIKLYSAIEYPPFMKNFVGRIKDVKDNIVVLEDKQGNIINIEYSKIARARLDVEI